MCEENLSTVKRLNAIVLSNVEIQPTLKKIKIQTPMVLGVTLVVLRRFRADSGDVALESTAIGLYRCKNSQHHNDS